MSDQVTATLREMILTGELKPGEQITHEQIATALDVSTMPVREALLRLAYEGLIEGGIKARSFRVSVTTRDDVDDIYWLQSVLSGELTARAALKLTDEQIESLSQAHQAWCDAADAGETTALIMANDDFHRVINLGADSPTLARFLRNTLRLIPHAYYGLVPDHVEKATDAHKAILTAIQAREPEAARAVAVSHVLESAKELISNFDHQGFWKVPTADGKQPS